ncbi:hypothetical protein BJ138DRAFT_351945 [Hygrophoropsis aurantiaca]|uniref:Uncharacterized protein n=1 Tax=Hygrophoropsis aurantiaca TaxID=72124 RepID=A0ACB8A6X9_9AGAM|nr:hypothetical protein BJ138DRAFT_351945 [Hygrophoropsis aurantiaca]
MSEQTKLRLLDTVQYIRNELALKDIEVPGTVMGCLHDVDEFISAIPVPAPRINFSLMEVSDLGKLGVSGKMLAFILGELAKLAQDFTSQQSAEIQLLRARILNIREHVNMDFVPRSRMILESIVLTLANIASDPHSQKNVAIFPEMMVTTDKGVKVINPESGYQAWLSGSVDYAIIQYKDENENKAHLLSSRCSAFMYLKVYTHRKPLTNRDEVRFCLSNGNSWLFFILKLREGKWRYFYSPPRQLEVGRNVSDNSLCVIMKLLLEWLAPTSSKFYELRDS